MQECDLSEGYCRWQLCHIRVRFADRGDIRMAVMTWFRANRSSSVKIIADRYTSKAIPSRPGSAPPSNFPSWMRIP